MFICIIVLASCTTGRGPDVEAPVALQGYEYRVSASSDDAEETASGRIRLKSSDLELTFDGSSDQTVGIRFTDVAIPAGATITGARIQFTVDETSSEATTLAIYGEASDNASTFRDRDFNISSRPKTARRVAWSPAPWSQVARAGAEQSTPNLAAVVQEIVNRPGWEKGNAIAFIITGQGERIAEAYDGQRASAPRFIVEYKYSSQAPSEPAPPPTDPTPPPTNPIPTPSPGDGSCLDSASGPLVTLKGDYRDEYEESDLPDNLRIDANGARFLAPAPEDPFTLNNVKSLCLTGGVYDPGISASESDWEVYHHSQGIYLRDAPNAVVENVSILNTGDGIRLTEGTSNWTLRDSYIGFAGDDAIENDFLYKGLVDDVLIDHAYVGFSCRLGSGDRFTGYSPGSTMTVENTLVHMGLQKGVYSGESPGGGKLWKWEQYDEPGCKLIMRNMIVLVDDGPRSNFYLSPADDPDLDYATVVESKNNVVVWTGKGDYPAPIPPGWTLTRDIGVWERARADWFARHPDLKP